MTSKTTIDAVYESAICCVPKQWGFYRKYIMLVEWFTAAFVVIVAVIAL